MTDKFSSAERSRIMGRISGAGTSPEKALRRLLRRKGFRLRLNVRTLPGKPDIVVPEYRTVIFVNGCFWHHHAGCKKAGLPATRARFWKTKILSNVERDRRQTAALRRLGWRVFVVWQCQLTPKKAEKKLSALVARLRS